jgi:hypothetical protein
VKSTIFDVPHYAVFSYLLALQLSSVHIFSSATCSETPSVYVPPLMSENKFHTHTEPQEKLHSYIFYFSRFSTAEKKTRVSGLNGSKHYLPVDSYHQYTPAADVPHLISVQPGFPGPFLMAFSKAKLKSSGDKAYPCFRPLWI